MAGSHLGPGALAVLGLAGLDEFLGAGQLGAQLAEVAGVGGEMIAGQAGVAAVAALGRGQQAHPVGQDPVGVPVQLHQLVDVGRVHLQRPGVTADLGEPQELRLVGLGQGLGVMHGHFRREVTHIPLHDVDGDPGVEQVGGLGVAHPVGALEVDRRAGGVGDLQRGGQLGELPVQGIGAVVALAGGVGLPGQEEIGRVGRGPIAGPHEGAGEVLLFFYDGCHVGADEDGLRRACDLGLLVAQPCGRAARFRCLAGVEARDGRQRGEVHHQDLVDPPAGGDREQERPHGLLVAQPLDLARRPVHDDGLGLVAGQSEDVGVLGDAGQGSRVDVVALGLAAVTAGTGDLTGPPPAGVGVGQPGPPRLGQFPGGFGAPVGHEGVKPGHRGLDQADGGGRERAASAGALLAEPGRQPQRHRAQPGVGAGGQDRGVDALGGQERGEVAAEVAQVARQRGPRQQPGGQPGREVPLDRLAQPGWADPGEIQPLSLQRLVLADRDPPVVTGGRPGRRASAHRAAGRWWPGGCAGSFRAAAGGAGRGSGGELRLSTPPRSGR